jgi:hypothetical protein
MGRIGSSTATTVGPTGLNAIMERVVVIMLMAGRIVAASFTGIIGAFESAAKAYGRPPGSFGGRLLSPEQSSGFHDPEPIIRGPFPISQLRPFVHIGSMAASPHA